MTSRLLTRSFSSLAKKNIGLSVTSSVTISSRCTGSTVLINSIQSANNVRASSSCVLVNNHGGIISRSALAPPPVGREQQQQQQVRGMASTGRRAGRKKDIDTSGSSGRPTKDGYPPVQPLLLNAPKFVPKEEIMAVYPPETPIEDLVMPDDHEEESDFEKEERLFFQRYKRGSNYRKRPKLISKKSEDDLFADSLVFPPEEFIWRPHLHKRCGAIGIKLGMMPLWDDWGNRHPCTVLWLDSNIVLRVKSSDGPDGYDSIQVGAGEYKRKNVKKPVLGQLKALGLDTEAYEQVTEHPPYIIREFRVTPDLPGGLSTVPKPGTMIHARHFVPGQCVDVSSISKGKGFQGAMKRHNFKGMPATHGVSKSHRALGSTGQCQTPGRVFKGKKMAGRMGADRVTVQNLHVMKIDRGKNLIYVKGAVPGFQGAFVEIRDAVKRPLFNTPKVLEEVKAPPLPTFEYDPTIDGTGISGHEIMRPLELIDPMEPEEDAA